jgi:pyridoxal 5'-phosphate synthase pdxS subunit
VQQYAQSPRSAKSSPEQSFQPSAPRPTGGFEYALGPSRALNINNNKDVIIVSDTQQGTWKVKVSFIQMLKGGVIMDVVNAEQAKLAEDAGAVAVMALERVPADIRATGGVARMSDPKMIAAIKEAVSIPVMAKARIGHFVEAQILEAIGVDCIDESEVLTPADDKYHIYKHDFKIPFVCGCRNLGEALRRIGEGAAMMRTKGEAGTGDIIEAVKHMRQVNEDIARLQYMPKETLMTVAKDLGAPYELVVQVAKEGKLPVINFAAGGVATPADAALMACSWDQASSSQTTQRRGLRQ